MRWYTIVLAILLLLGLTLMLRFGVRLTSRAGRTSLALQVGGISVLRLPLGEKRPPKVGKKKKEKKKETARRAEQKDAGKKEELSRLLAAANDAGFVLETLRKGLSVTREKLLRRIVVNRLTVHIAATAQEPMKTTLQYGALSASVWGAAAALSHLVRLRRRDIVLVPDYGAVSCTVELDIQAWLRLWQIIAAIAGYAALWREVRGILESRAAESKGKTPSPAQGGAKPAAPAQA